MAMLTSGEYNLNPKNADQNRKSMFYVKMTDSAVRTLAEYLSGCHMNNTKEIPQIEFTKNEGRIFIPSNSKSNHNTPDKCMAQFKFDVTSNMTMHGTQGLLDCVQHEKRNSKQLMKCGSLTQRLRIHANEDVYETTKNRMAAIELENRKSCTRRLGFMHMNLNSKFDKLGKFSSTQQSPSSTIKSDDRDTKLAVSSAVTTLAPENSNMFRSKSRSVYNPPPPQQKINANACKMRKPLRERLIQMLAVRPYKRCELLSTLKQEGLRDCDKPHFSDVLGSVSTLRDNFHHLEKSAWQDVQEDWLFYSEQEKQSVQKNKLRNLTSPSSSSDSGISTSSNQSPGEKSPPSSYKRPGYINGADGFLTKRQRISRVGQPTAISSTRVLASSSSNPTYDENNAQRGYDDYLRPSPTSSADRLPSLLRNSQQRASSSSLNSVASSCTFPSEYRSSEANTTTTYRKDTPPPIVSSTTEGEDSSPLNGNSPIDDFNNEVVSTTATAVASSTTPPSPPAQFHKFVRQQQPLDSPGVVMSNTTAASQPPPNKRYIREKPKYMKEYVTITDTEQRRRYKADFAEIFKEYTRVHGEIDAVSNQFAQMGECLRQHKKGSPKYTKIESEIFSKYYALKQSLKFQAAKRRFEYLHEKLSHIKQLVHDYDQKNTANHR